MTNEPTPDLKIGVAESATDRPDGTEPRAEFVSAYFHGTRADLTTGDLISRGYTSNYGTRREANFVYVTANLGRPFGAQNSQSALTPENLRSRTDW